MSRPETHFATSLFGAHPDQLWVITCYFNPCNYQSRWENYETFARRLLAQGARLLTVQLRRTAADTVLPADLCTQLVDIVEPDVLWAKECLLNVALRHLPPACTKVCWCDCDLIFANDNWLRDCADALDRHRVIQPFAYCRLMLRHEKWTDATFALGQQESFGKMMQERLRTNDTKPIVESFKMFSAHPGFVWAARREVLHAAGGFCDLCIIGHGDLAMALGFAHSPERDGPMRARLTGFWQPKWSHALGVAIRQWQRRASDVVRGDVGFCDGTVYHLWHGAYHRRFYHERAVVLAELDPARDMTRAASGIWQWTAAARARDIPARLEAYFRDRAEDSSAKVSRTLPITFASAKQRRLEWVKRESILKLRAEMEKRRAS
jgi:hypothetical protein